MTWTDQTPGADGWDDNERWILAYGAWADTGFWNDGAVWRDAENWTDN